MELSQGSEDEVGPWWGCQLILLPPGDSMEELMRILAGREQILGRWELGIAWVCCNRSRKILLIELN